MTRARRYSAKEEFANALSHAAGILLGIVAGFILLPKVLKSHDTGMFVSVSIYLFGMLSCYVISTLYHGSKNRKKKQILQKFDHASIYLHITGTYMPFILLIFRQNSLWGWSLGIFIWLCTIVGIGLSFRKSFKHSNIETICYIAMGCAILIALKPLLSILNSMGEIASLYWLISGGVSYIIGAVFYSFTRKKYMHTVFHLFVLGGSICHIIAIYIIS